MSTPEANQAPPEWAVKAATRIVDSYDIAFPDVNTEPIAAIIARHALQPTPPALALTPATVGDELARLRASLALANLHFATLCDMVLGEDAMPRTDEALMHGVRELLKNNAILQAEVERLNKATRDEIWNMGKKCETALNELRQRAETAERERLNQGPAYEFDPSTGIATSVPSLRARLAALTSRNAELREALAPFAALDVAHMISLKKKPEHPVFGLNSTQFNLGDVLNAKAALAADAGKDAKAREEAERFASEGPENEGDK